MERQTSMAKLKNTFLQLLVANKNIKISENLNLEEQVVSEQKDPVLIISLLLNS
jgi:hypothetical protein